MSVSELDPIDTEILGILQDNGRMSVAEVAREVALSPTAVKRRIALLEESRVITGYSARVDYERLGWNVAAFIEVRFTGTTSGDDMERLAASLPEASAVYTTAGDQDVLVLARATSLAHLREVINKLRATSGIISTRSHVILDTSVKDDWRPPNRNRSMHVRTG
jgi:DNA-binding Lrp family transcriptional regulator